MFTTIFFVCLSAVSISTLSIQSTGEFPHKLDDEYIIQLNGNKDGKFRMESNFTIVIKKHAEIVEKFEFSFLKSAIFTNGKFMDKVRYEANETKISIRFNRRGFENIFEVYKTGNPVTQNRIFRHYLDLQAPSTLNMTSKNYFIGRKQMFEIRCESSKGLPPRFPRFTMSYDIKKLIISEVREKKKDNFVIVLKLELNNFTNGEEVACFDGDVIKKTNIAMYSHPDKVVISPSSPRFSMARGDTLVCTVMGGHLNVSSLVWTVLVDGVEQHDQGPIYTLSEFLSPLRSRLTLIRAADWATLRLGCEAVSTVNRDTKIVRHVLPLLLIRPASYPREIDNSTNNLIQSINRRFIGVEKTIKQLQTVSFVKVLNNNTLFRNYYGPGEYVEMYLRYKKYENGLSSRLRLWIYPNGTGEGNGTHLSVFFVILRSEYDSLYSWPFKKKIAVSLLQRDGVSTIKTMTIQYDKVPAHLRLRFDRPTTERNEGIGSETFVLLSELKKLDNLNIFIVCKISPL